MPLAPVFTLYTIILSPPPPPFPLYDTYILSDNCPDVHSICRCLPNSYVTTQAVVTTVNIG